MSPHAYIWFHLNLAFSSISIESRSDVIRRCYRPLLEMAKNTGIPLGIEVSGWTLAKIHELDPEWIDEFKDGIDNGLFELIGSGFVQLIGPLVPYSVNRWNQQLGLDIYNQLLGIRPKLILVNEMVFSSSMVDIYAEFGYSGFIMERNNIFLALDVGEHNLGDLPTHGVGPEGSCLPVLWADSIFFQQLQRYVHGDIRRDVYLEFISERIATGDTFLPIYSNDAEVFDFRPGRFSTESPTHPAGEWNRMKTIFELLSSQNNITWLLPSEALERKKGEEKIFTSPMVSSAQPIPVKKQSKYNLSRWAITGRNDAWINTMCHRFVKHLERLPSSEQTAEDWQQLCMLWSTDLRTHISLDRWDLAIAELDCFARRLGVSTEYGVGQTDRNPELLRTRHREGVGDRYRVKRDYENLSLFIESETIQLSLNLRRGLAINSLAFKSHGFVPTLGTLSHGYFDTIELGADYYTGGVVVEIPGKRRRITDLEPVNPEVSQTHSGLQIRAVISTECGDIVKTVCINDESESVSLQYEFPRWVRPVGSVRAGILTLLPEAFPRNISVQCKNGGKSDETFTLDRFVDHPAAPSSAVSATTGLGATDGRIRLGADGRFLHATWDPTQCSVFPMIIHLPLKQRFLTRLVFSLAEYDETSVEGGKLGSFSLRLTTAD